MGLQQTRDPGSRYSKWKHAKDLIYLLTGGTMPAGATQHSGYVLGLWATYYLLQIASGTPAFTV